MGSRDGNLHAVNPDGTEKWITDEGWYWIDSSPVIGADGTVYVGSNIGSVAAEVSGRLIALGP